MTSKQPKTLITMQRSCVRGTLLWCALGASGLAPVWADTAVKIPRESGQTHQEFLNIFAEPIRQLPGGVGRLHFINDKQCKADFFVNSDTTYVVLDISSSRFRQEFYIDHPHQSFSPVLFQNVVMNEYGTGIQVQARTGDYEVMNDGETLRLSVRKAADKTPSVCEFSLSSLVAYPGEME